MKLYLPLAGSIAILAAVGVTERAAEACGGGGSDSSIESALVVFGTAAALDVSFSVHDLVVYDSSTGYAAFESLVTVPQVILGGWLLASGELQQDPQSGQVVGVYTAWMAALAIHGIYEIAEGDGPRRSRVEKAPPPAQHWGPPGASSSIHVSPAPSAVVDAQGALAPGMGLVGTF